MKKIKFSKLKTTAQLIQTLKDLDINEKNFLSSGSTATVFMKNNQAVKVCPRNIRYFSHYKGNPQSFKNHINTMGDIFLPVNEILYEDSDFFIYTQDLCQPLKRTDINKKITIEVLKLLKSLIENNCIITDLAPGNFCLYKEKILIFDYHGLHKLKNFRSSRIASNLTKYMTLTFCPKKYHDHEIIMTNYKKKTIKKLHQLPSSFIDLLLAMLDEKLSPDDIIDHIDRCIKQLGG